MNSVIAAVKLYKKLIIASVLLGGVLGGLISAAKSNSRQYVFENSLLRLQDGIGREVSRPMEVKQLVEFEFDESPNLDSGLYAVKFMPDPNYLAIKTFGISEESAKTETNLIFDRVKTKFQMRPPLKKKNDGLSDIKRDKALLSAVGTKVTQDVASQTVTVKTTELYDFYMRLSEKLATLEEKASEPADAHDFELVSRRISIGASTQQRVTEGIWVGLVFGLLIATALVTYTTIGIRIPKRTRI